MPSLEPDVMKYLIDDAKNVVINRRILLYIKNICEQASKGPWTYDENENCQRIFGAEPISVYTDENGKTFEFMGHAMQLAKCPKKSKEFAEYWFTEQDMNFIITASKWMLPLVDMLLKQYPEEKE